jgi:hypothetical protein
LPPPRRKAYQFDSEITLGKTMAGDDKKAKTTPAPKKEAPAVDKSTTGAAPSKAADAAPPKAEGGETAAAAPAGYSRGEGQKPVTQAYKDNWNAIFAKKKTEKKKKR